MKRNGIFLGGSRWQNGHYQSGEPAFAPPPDPPAPELAYPNIGVGTALVGNSNGVLDFNLSNPETFTFCNLNFNYPVKYIDIDDGVRMAYSVPEANYTPLWDNFNTNFIGQLNTGPKTNTLLPNDYHLFVNAWLKAWDNYPTWQAQRPLFKDPINHTMLITNPRFWVNYTAWYWRIEQYNNETQSWEPVQLQSPDDTFDLVRLKQVTPGAELAIDNYFSNDNPDFLLSNTAFAVKNAGGILPAEEIDSVNHTATDYVGSLGNLNYKDVKSVLDFLGYRHKQTREQVAGYLGVDTQYISAEPLPFGNGNLVGLPYIIPWRWRYEPGASVDFYPVQYTGGTYNNPLFIDDYIKYYDGLINPLHCNEPFAFTGFDGYAPTSWENRPLGNTLGEGNPFFTCVRNFQHRNNRYFYLDNLYDIFVIRDRKYMTYTAIQFFLVAQRLTDMSYFVVGG